MRARFSAYALGQVDYLVYSHAPSTRSPELRNAVREWARKAEFRELRILETKAGSHTDQEGIVIFEADYIENGAKKTLAERSIFGRYEGRWVYEKGTAPRTATVTRQSQKVGRNDPCPCGSGAKYKKCCLSRS
jgi:SEC-C motif-containing protein